MFIPSFQWHKRDIKLLAVLNSIPSSTGWRGVAIESGSVWVKIILCWLWDIIMSEVEFCILRYWKNLTLNWYNPSHSRPLYSSISPSKDIKVTKTSEILFKSFLKNIFGLVYFELFVLFEYVEHSLLRLIVLNSIWFYRRNLLQTTELYIL